MITIYKYRFDRRTLYWTLAHLAVFTLIGFGLYYLYEGGYFSAWFTSFIVALIALMTLSIPRKIVVKEDAVETAACSISPKFNAKTSRPSGASTIRNG